MLRDDKWQLERLVKIKQKCNMLYIQTQILVLALLLIWPSKILTLLKAQFSHLQNQVKCNHTAHFYCALCVFTLSSIIKFIYHLFNKCVGDIYCEDEDHKNKAGKSTLEKVKHISDIAMTTTSAITVQLLSNRNSIIFKVRSHTHTHTHTDTNSCTVSFLVQPDSTSAI